MYPNLGVCNIGGSVQLGRYCDEKRLKKVLNILIQENPVLCLQIDRFGKPYLDLHEVILYQWNGNENPTQEQLSHWLMIPFGEKDCSLCEFMYRYTDDGTILFVKVHHLLLDSYGITICLKKLLMLLDKIEDGKNEYSDNLAVDSRFIDTMKDEHPVSERALTWFSRQFSLNDVCGQPMKTTSFGEINGTHKRFHIPDCLFQQMKQVEADQGFSLEVQFAASLSVYFARVNGSGNYTFGRSLLNRRKADMDLPGMMANTLPVFIKLQDSSDFWCLCRKIKDYFYSMMRYSNLDQEILRQRLGVTRPLYDVMLTFRRQKFIPFIGEIEQKEIDNPLLEIPLRIYLDELPEGLRADFHYQISCYQEKEIEAIYARLLWILEQGLKNAYLNRITVLSGADRKLWTMLNATECPFPEETILQKIRHIAEKSGSKMALCYRESHLTYKEMLEKAGRVAFFLLEHGVRSGSIVGVCLDRPLEIPCVFLGIWEAGAAFLPVSTRESEARVREVSRMCDYFWDGSIRLDGISAVPETVCFPECSFELPAYCMFTSGSTGKAKAAVISHLSLACRLSWMEQKWHCADSVLQKAAYTFDVSVWEYFLPLSQGGCLYLLDEAEKKNPEVILSSLAYRKIRTVHFVPSLLSVWMDYAQKRKAQLPYLEHVFSSGEALSPELADRFYRQFPDVRLHNLYGPTECTIDVTGYDCKKGDKTIPIGTPAFWTRVEIVDNEKRCLPPGVEGELSIRGALVGEGYYEYESDRFRTGEQGEKIFDTGDRAMLGFDGQIYYLGRRDGQRKINGMRIDLEQIESVMRMMPEVQRAAVLCQKNRIIGFYMANKPVEDMQHYLTEKLPYYCIPSKIVFCREMPLTPNGKIDRSSLSEQIPPVHTHMPQNKREKILLDLVREEIGIQVDPEENLFLAGLDSLSVMALVLKAEEKGIYLTTTDFYEKRSIRALAELEKPGCCWLNRQANQCLVVAFPYAAGSAEDYTVLAKLLKRLKIDFCVAADAEKIPDISFYDKTVLLGYCTGTAEALRLAADMNDMGKKPDGMVLCAAIPPSEKEAQRGSPWRFMSDHTVERFLNYLHGGSARMDENTIRLFRKDTDRYFSYFQRPGCSVDINAVILLGERDILTFPARFRQKQWKKYLKGSISCHILSHRGHFFLDRSARLIAGEIHKLFEKCEK
ncbi:MAG: AMP-binding protein [Lachnospiraceae bacterium]|nr:AMP-binding protein [Lachnospiraceae bacterium]